MQAESKCYPHSVPLAPVVDAVDAGVDASGRHRLPACAIVMSFVRGSEMCCVCPDTVVARRVAMDWLTQEASRCFRSTFANGGALPADVAAELSKGTPQDALHVVSLKIQGRARWGDSEAVQLRVARESRLHYFALQSTGDSPADTTELLGAADIAQVHATAVARAAKGGDPVATPATDDAAKEGPMAVVYSCVQGKPVLRLAASRADATALARAGLQEQAEGCFKQALAIRRAFSVTRPFTDRDEFETTATDDSLVAAEAGGADTVLATLYEVVYEYQATGARGAALTPVGTSAAALLTESELDTVHESAMRAWLRCRSDEGGAAKRPPQRDKPEDLPASKRGRSDRDMALQRISAVFDSEGSGGAGSDPLPTWLRDDVCAGSAWPHPDLGVAAARFAPREITEHKPAAVVWAADRALPPPIRAAADAVGAQLVLAPMDDSGGGVAKNLGLLAEAWPALRELEGRVLFVCNQGVNRSALLCKLLMEWRGLVPMAKPGVALKVSARRAKREEDKMAADRVRNANEKARGETRTMGNEVFSALARRLDLCAWLEAKL